MGSSNDILSEDALHDPRIRSSIPWAEPRYWGNERRYVQDAMQSTWISGGPYVDRLETDLASFVDVPEAVVTSNGTTAIHAAYLALDVRPGDEIIVPGFAYMAAANIALLMGAIPKFADVDLNTWCITAETIAAKVTSRTKGIVPIHTYGNVCDMAPILEFANERGLWVLEDAAEALGSKYRGIAAGSVASIGTYSFHATKTITTGEGGAVVTRDALLAERLRLFRSHGVSQRRYWHEVPGHNFRLTNIQAAIGCAQFERLSDIQRERDRVYETYKREFTDFAGVAMQAITLHVEPLMWAVGIRLLPTHFRHGRDSVMQTLAAAGIETRPGFHAASEMASLYNAPSIPVAAQLAREIISLPSSPTVKNNEIRLIAEIVRNCCDIV